MSTKIITLLVALTLVAAACGDTTAEPTDGPVAAGACTAEDPDCEDTLIGDEPLPGAEPIPGDDPVTVNGGGFVADEGLTVSDALATDAADTLAIRGFLFADDQGWRLCEALAESFPPQCGGASLAIAGVDDALAARLVEEEPIEESQGVKWTDQHIWLFGEIVDGELVLDATILG